METSYQEMKKITSSSVPGMVIDEVMLRGKNGEDRSVVLHFEHGTLISIFDGEYVVSPGQYDV